MKQAKRSSSRQKQKDFQEIISKAQQDIKGAFEQVEALKTLYPHVRRQDGEYGFSKAIANMLEMISSNLVIVGERIENAIQQKRDAWKSAK